MDARHPQIGLGQHRAQNPLVGGETLGLSPTSSSSSSSLSRTKPVAIACERCRRRKIRCDGETPCATCRRFGIICVRPSKHDTHVLEQRVRHLEAQIADLTASLKTQNQSQSPGQIKELSITATVQQPPQQQLPWSLDYSFNLDFPPSSPGSSSVPTISEPTTYAGDLSPSSSDIPRIEVNCYPDMSPASLSPSPSLSPAVSILPTGGVLGGTGLRPPVSTVHTFSPPATAYPSPSSGPISLLNPYMNFPELPPRSRTPSLSSVDYESLSRVPSNLPSIYTDLSPSISESMPSPSDIDFPLSPIVDEHKMLLEKFYGLTHGSGYPIERETLFDFLNLIDRGWEYPGSQHESFSAASASRCSPSMARFHVYMAMAVTLQMEGNMEPSAKEMLRFYYDVAIKEASQSFHFWEQPFATEAALLLALFARVSRGEELTPKTLKYG